MANLLLNPDFELDSAGANPPASWGNFNSPSNVTRAVATDFVHGGTKSWKVNTTDVFTADCGINQTEFTRSGGTKITVSPSTQYYFSCYIKTILTTGQAHVHIKLFDAGYTNEAGYDTSNVTLITDWILNDKTFTTTSTQVICEIMACFGAYGAAANGIAWFDDFYLDAVNTTKNLAALGVG